MPSAFANNGWVPPRLSACKNRRPGHSARFLIMTVCRHRGRRPRPTWQARTRQPFQRGFCDVKRMMGLEPTTSAWQGPGGMTTPGTATSRESPVEPLTPSLSSRSNTDAGSLRRTERVTKPLWFVFQGRRASGCDRHLLTSTDTNAPSNVVDFALGRQPRMRQPRTALLDICAVRGAWSGFHFAGSASPRGKPMTWFYVLVGALGAAVAIGELVSHYRDAPMRALATFPALLYIGINAGASLGRWR